MAPDKFLPDLARSVSSGAAEDAGGGAVRTVALRSGERLARIPGAAFVYTNTYAGIPPAFTNMLANIPALHEVVVFITIRCAPAPASQSQRTLSLESIARGGEPAMSYRLPKMSMLTLVIVE